MTDTAAVPVPVPETPGTWAFTPEVAAGFDGHVTASVPFYREIQDLVAEVADWLAPAGSVVADLGAATGTTAALVQSRHPGRDHRFHLYDESRAMLDAAVAKLGRGAAVTVRCGPVQAVPFDHPPASLTLCLFTLHFLPPADRVAVLRKAASASRGDGAVLLAEKLRLPDSRWAEIGMCASHDYKERGGVGAADIRAKERSLRGVLVPWADEENRQALAEAGWRRPEVLFRWHQWVLYGAFAGEAGR
jgi:tRNA (cmo5U34)-methyltransferase